MQDYTLNYINENVRSSFYFEKLLWNKVGKIHTTDHDLWWRANWTSETSKGSGISSEWLFRPNFSSNSWASNLHSRCHRVEWDGRVQPVWWAGRNLAGQNNIWVLQWGFYHEEQVSYAYTQNKLCCTTWNVFQWLWFRAQLVYASFGEGGDQFSPSCIQAYETALSSAQKSGVKVRALLLCNPHNPLGKCYPVETLKELMLFCAKHDLHLISDEIYALSVFEVDGSPERTGFTSILSLDPDEGGLGTQRIHVMYGMSKVSSPHLSARPDIKYFLPRSPSSADWFDKLGFWCSRASVRLFNYSKQTANSRNTSHWVIYLPVLHDLNWHNDRSRFNWPSEISCQIATKILEDKAFIAEYTCQSRLGLARNYQIVTELLDAAGIEYSRGGYVSLLCSFGIFAKWSWDTKCEIVLTND